jgi:hypothetical protein
MAPSTLTPPRRTASPAGRSADGRKTPPLPAAPPPRRRRREPRWGRVAAWGLAISVGLHLILFLLSPTLFRVDVSRVAGTPASDPDAVPAMQMIDPVISADAPAEPDEVVVEAPAPRAATRPSPAAPTPGDDPPSADPGEPGAERGDPFAPGFRDGRLYVAPREVEPAEEELTEHERYMRHFQARIDAINDSIAGVTAREAAGTDWTRTDRQGRRWGVSPGELHLGDVTIPLPTGFQAPREREDEARERARTREEIDRQEQDRQVREARDERNRRAAERREGGGG